MSKIGNIVATGSVTLNPSYLPQFLQIGTVTDSATITGLSISARGQTIIDVSDERFIELAFKLESKGLFAGNTTTLGKSLLLSTGRIEGQSVITIDQAVTTETSAVYEHSTGKSPNNLVRRLVVSPVIALGNLRFSNQDYIAFNPSNVTKVQITFENGFNDEFSTDELAGMYNLQYPAEGDGLVAAQLVLPFLRAEAGFRIKEAIVYAGASNVNVLCSGWMQI